MFRFLPSIVILQLLLAGTVYGAIYSGTTIAFSAVGVFIVVSSVLFSLWIKSLSDLNSKDEIAKHKDKFAKEREQILVKAEKEKLKVVKDSQNKFNKDTSRANAKANFKVGAAVAGAVGLGAFFMVGQMVTLGLLTLSTAGGGLAGYLVRARQDKKLLASGSSDSKSEKLAKPKVINALGFDKKKSDS